MNLYNSEGYFSPTEYEALTNIEKAERVAAKAAAFPPDCVYMLSLFRRRGTQYRKCQTIQPFCGRQALSFHNTAHLLYTVHG